MRCEKCKKFIKHDEYKLCRSCTGVTVRVTFKDGRVMLFGDSYKKWEVNFKEYTSLLSKDNKPILFEESRKAWIGGGAKWRSLQAFIDEIYKNSGMTIDDFDFKNIGEMTKENNE